MATKAKRTTAKSEAKRKAKASTKGESRGSSKRSTKKAAKRRPVKERAARQKGGKSEAAATKKSGTKRAAKKQAPQTAKRTASEKRHNGAESIKASNLTAEEKRFLARNKDKLSSTTLRAKWVHSPDEGEDRPGQSLATREHEVIKSWAEQRGAVPATVKTRQSANGSPRVLRFDFPGYGGQNLEEIDWDAWFETFDARKLIFLYQDHKRDGNQSNFFRFDTPLR